MSKSRDRALMSLPRSISVGRSASALSGTRVSRECGWVSVLGYPSRNSMSPIPVHSPRLHATSLSASPTLPIPTIPQRVRGSANSRRKARIFLEAYCLGPESGDCDGHGPELVGPCGDPLRKVSGGAPADLAAFARS